MAEKAIITPNEEVGAEGSVAASINSPEVAPKEDKSETVPLAVYLELKKDLKALEKEVKNSSSSERQRVAIDGADEIARKYPDVNQDFINDIISAADSVATKKIEAKYAPIIEQQETEKKQQAFDKAFNELFDKAVKDNPDLPKTIDRDAIKELAQTKKYINTPISDILANLYGSNVQGKSSSENETRSAPDKVDDIVDFSRMTDTQRSAVMDDPKARKKYFEYLDTIA